MTSCKEGEGGKVYCDTRVKCIMHKCRTEEKGASKSPNLRDIIYEWFLNIKPTLKDSQTEENYCIKYWDVVRAWKMATFLYST